MIMHLGGKPPTPALLALKAVLELAGWRVDWTQEFYLKGRSSDGRTILEVVDQTLLDRFAVWVWDAGAPSDAPGLTFKTPQEVLEYLVSV